jgi:hypothetical protein
MALVLFSLAGEWVSERFVFVQWFIFASDF